MPKCGSWNCDVVKQGNGGLWKDFTTKEGEPYKKWFCSHFCLCAYKKRWDAVNNPQTGVVSTGNNNNKSKAKPANHASKKAMDVSHGAFEKQNCFFILGEETDVAVAAVAD